MTRPEDLLYTVDELPPWPRLLFLGMQHAMLMSVYLVLIVIVFRHAGASYAATLNALSFGMIALAASTVLKASGKVRLARDTSRRPYFRRSISAPLCWRPPLEGFQPSSE
jgi:xanthine/uracil permease